MNLAHQVGAAMMKKKATLSTAESCTGGLVSHLLTNVPGSSSWYMGGVVSYTNELKHAILGVRQETLTSQGAVSEAVVEQMARGARQAFETDYAISITGIAGPGGGTEQKPVGLVYIGVATPDTVEMRRFVWNGSREANKQSSAEAALTLLLEQLEVETPSRQPVAVDASFEPDGRIRPLAFHWQGRQLKVTDWGRQWEKDGERHFLVMTAADAVWEIRFVPTTLQWSVTPKSDLRRTV